MYTGRTLDSNYSICYSQVQVGTVMDYILDYFSQKENQTPLGTEI